MRRAFVANSGSSEAALLHAVTTVYDAENSIKDIQSLNRSAAASL